MCGEADVVNRRGIAKLIVFVLFACAALAVSVFTPIGDYFSKENIGDLVARLGVWGPVGLVAVSLVSPLFFLPRWPVAWVSGLLYGIFWGTILATLASSLGALVHYVFARTLLAPSARRVLARFQLEESNFSQKSLFYMFFFMRAFPLSNYVATNMLAGAMKVRPATYIAATVLGMIPSSIMYAAWGKVMKERTSSFSMVAIFSVIFILLGCILVQKKILPWLKAQKNSEQ